MFITTRSLLVGFAVAFLCLSSSASAQEGEIWFERGEAYIRLNNTDIDLNQMLIEILDQDAFEPEEFLQAVEKGFTNYYVRNAKNAPQLLEALRFVSSFSEPAVEKHLFAQANLVLEGSSTLTIPLDVLSEVQEGLVDAISEIKEPTTVARGMLQVVTKTGVDFEVRLQAAQEFRYALHLYTEWKPRPEFLIPTGEATRFVDVALAAYAHGVITINELRGLFDNGRYQIQTFQKVVQFVKGLTERPRGYHEEAHRVMLDFAQETLFRVDRTQLEYNRLLLALGELTVDSAELDQRLYDGMRASIPSTSAAATRAILTRLLNENIKLTLDPAHVVSRVQTVVLADDTPKEVVVVFLEFLPKLVGSDLMPKNDALAIANTIRARGADFVIGLEAALKNPGPYNDLAIEATLRINKEWIPEKPKTFSDVVAVTQKSGLSGRSATKIRTAVKPKFSKDAIVKIASKIKLKH